MLFTSPLRMRSYRPSLSSNDKASSTSNYLNVPNFNDDIRQIRNRAKETHSQDSSSEIQEPLHLLQRTIQQTLSDPTITQTSTFQFYAPAAAFLGLILSLIFILQNPHILEQCHTASYIHTNVPEDETNHPTYVFAKCVIKTSLILLSGIPLALLLLKCLIFIGADCAKRFAKLDLREKGEESEMIRELNQKDLFLGAFS